MNKQRSTTKLYTTLAALGYWLSSLEALVTRAGLHGLSWGGGYIALAGGLTLAQRARPSLGTLLLTLPLAGVSQVGLAALRRHQLDPKRQLAPGVYADRVVARLDLPAQHGPIPALHIVPTGGAQAAVCVAHGSGGDKTFYAWRLVTALVARGLAVVLVDLDGHGESLRVQAFPTMVESVAGPVDWLRTRYERVGLLGMSLGGAVTARAVAEGAPCEAMALWAAPPRLRLSMAAYRRVQIREGIGIVRPTLLHLFSDGAPQHIIGAWRTNGIRASISTWDLFDALDLLGSLERIKAQATRPPLLLYYAGRDAVLHPGSAEEVRRATAGWSEYRLVRAASHVSLALEPAVLEGTASWLAARLMRSRRGTEGEPSRGEEGQADCSRLG